MKEVEYIRGTNRAKVSMAIAILRDILPGEDYIVGEEELREVVSRLKTMEERLFGSFKCVD